MDLKSTLVPTLNKSPRRERIPLEAEGTEIPRIIHQTFRTKDLPPALAANVREIRERNPGWEHRLYDDADIEAFLRDNYPPLVLDYYKRINSAYGAARADFFRYCLLYKQGGVYLDIKSAATRPLDECLLAGDRFLVSQWGDEEAMHVAWGAHHDLTEVPGGEFQQWFIVSAPGHPFLKAVIEAVMRNMDLYMPALHGAGHYGLMRATGPIAYTKAIAPIVDEHPHRFVRSKTELGLLYTMFQDETVHRKLSARHYTQLSEPIFDVPLTNVVVGQVYGALRSVWAGAKRRMH